MKIDLFLKLTLLFYKYQLAFGDVIKKIPPAPEERGVRCGFSIFSQRYLAAALLEAQAKLHKDVFFPPKISIFNYPEVYDGYFGFPEENGRNLLWPLKDPRRGKSRIISSSSGYFLVMGGEVLHQIGVVERLSWDKYIRCVSEDDMSRVQGSLIVGFQCPFKHFPQESIKKALFSVSDHMEKSARRSTPSKFPLLYGSKPLFDISGPLYLWPIQVAGNFNPHAITSVVIDKDNNFVGMLHQSLRGKAYLRCKATSFHEPVARFIHSTILQEPIQVNSNQVDVFQCGRDFLRAGWVLSNFVDASEGFIIQKRYGHRLYPDPVSKTFDDNSAEIIYLWPICPEGSSVFKTGSKSFLIHFDFFLMITDFGDIVGVTELDPEAVLNGKGKYLKGENALENLQNCVRKAIPWKQFIDYALKLPPVLPNRYCERLPMSARDKPP